MKIQNPSIHSLKYHRKEEKSMAISKFPIFVKLSESSKKLIRCSTPQLYSLYQI